MTSETKPDPEVGYRKALKPPPWEVDDKAPPWGEPILSRARQLDEYERHRPHNGPLDADMEKRLESRNQRRLRYHIRRGAQAQE